MSRSRKYMITAIIGGALSGCASFPTSVDTLPARDSISEEMEVKWASMPAVRVLHSKTGDSVRRRTPLPSSVSEFPLKFSLNAKSTLEQFVSAIELQGVRVVLKVSSEKRQESVQVTNFHGTLGQTLEALSLTHDLDFEYVDGVIVLSSGVRYMVTVPQNEELLKRVPVAIEGLGARNIKADIDSGLVTYEANSSARRDIDLYLQRMANNAAMIAMQIAVIDVRLNRDSGRGFDWNEFSAKWGNAITPDSASSSASGQSVSTGVGAAVAERVLGSVASLNGGGFGIKIDEAKFSLVAAIKLLSKYGKAQTNQDVLISTLSGAPVKISSGSQIPYVSGVGAVAAVGGAVAGSVNTSTVNSGLKIDIVPRYDAADQMVVTNVKAKLSSLVRFRELSAGNTVGTISQPEIQELEFENISRLRPGEVIMLGGIAYDQVSESYTALSGLEKTKTGSEAITTNRHAIFIVIRPSITIFGDTSVLQGSSHAGSQ